MRLKSIFKRLLQILAVLLLLLLLFFAVLFAIHLFNREELNDYLPEGALAYVQLESIEDLYNNIIDLRALEILMTVDEWNGFHQLLLDYKNNVESRSFLFQQLLKLKASLIINNDYNPILIIDPQLKGMFTRFAPSMMGYLLNEDLSLTLSSIEDETIYTLNYKNEANYHLLFRKNLIFISLEKEDLISALKSKENGEAQSTSMKFDQIEEVKVKNSIVDMYLDTESILSDISIRDFVEFPSYSSLSLALSNQNIHMKWSSDLIAKDQRIKDFLSFESEIPKAVEVLPATTNIYGFVNFKSFKDFYEILTDFNDEFLLESYDKFINFLLGMTSEDILFSWTGQEAGFFATEIAAEPVMFIREEDSDALDHVLNQIDRSLILKVSNSLVVDDVRISKFDFSGLGQVGASLADLDLELPYFIRFKDYIFLSMNPELLAHTYLNTDSSEKLVNNKAYKEIASRMPVNSNFMFYYDLNSAMPRFIAESPILFQLLSEYEKGIASFDFNENKVTLNLSAINSVSDRTTIYPGYPKESNGLAINVFTADVTGGRAEELIYLNDEFNLYINDISNNELSSYKFRREGSLSLTPENELFYHSHDGWFYKLDGEGQMINPFPMRSTANDSFPPLFTDDEFFVFSSDSFELQRYNFAGTLLKRVNVPKKVFSQPLLVGNTMFYYPKSLLGTVYGSTFDGEPLEGWPNDSMGVSFSTPFIFNENIGFLTQKGSLNLWGIDGNVVDGFPINLDGVFYATPVPMESSENILALINSDGRLTLLNHKGTEIRSLILEDWRGKDTKLFSYQGEEMKEPILFVYGSTNYIMALDQDLQVLPGFPVKGYTKPHMSDLNSDGYYEIITAGYDKKIYIYTLRNN